MVGPFLKLLINIEVLERAIEGTHCAVSLVSCITHFSSFSWLINDSLKPLIKLSTIYKRFNNNFNFISFNIC